MTSSIPSGQPQGPLPGDGTVVQSFTSGGSQTFLFPLSAQSIYFLTRGNYQAGTLKFELAPAGSDPTKVIVNIVLSSDAAVAFNVSLLEKSSSSTNGYGVGFYTPNTITSNPPTLQFTVTVQFPATTGSALSFQNLSTSLGNWSQTFDVNNMVDFKSVSLTSGDGSVDIDGGATLGSTTITVGSGSVNGSFTSTQDVNITASNGAINITTTITNESNPSTCKLSTTGGPITAEISLDSNSTGSVFNVNTTTSNGALSLKFPNMPVSLPFPILNLNGSTTNASIDVSLHPTYEGTINLTSSSGNVPVLNVDSSVQDPSGQGRTRIVTGPTVAGDTLNAAVGWGQASPPNAGSVTLTTTNGGDTCHI